MIIDIYRGASITASAEIDSSTVFSAQVNGEDKITATFKSATPLNLMIKDYIVHKGLKYQILKFVDLSINHEYTYSAVLMGTSYNLFNKPFLSSTGTSTFVLTGTATQLLTILVAKINTVDSGWTVGTVFDEGAVKEVQFIGDDCRSALGRIFRAFDLEVSYVVKQINLVKRFELIDDTIELAYGQGNGLYNLSKRIEGDFFSRVRGFGSSRNIPANYRGGLERLSFDPGYIDIEDAASYGDPVEIEVVFEDIYPHRTGAITAAGIATIDFTLLADTTIDFNLADNFITGETPKIVMDSGHWQGSEFEIVVNSYDHANKSFKIRPNKEGGYYFPNSTLPIQIGDTYKFIGINLPQSYVNAAEAAVKSLTQQYAAIEPTLDVAYELVIDPIHVLDNGLIPKLNIGQKIKLTDAPTGINANMRITSISYPLISPELVTATISDKVTFSEEKQIQRIVIESAKQLPVIKENIAKVKAFTSQRLDETINMVFDPQGNYYTEKIKPLSIETLQLTVGSRTQMFTLSVIFQQNYLNNPNSFYWQAGKLAHYTVVPGSTFTWNIPAGSITGLTNASAYYIYARCNKANNNGVIVLDTVARQIESDSTYYYFLIGTLNSVIDGIRAISLSYGIAETNGKFIKGVLTSDDGYSTLDLNTGEYRGRMQFLNSDESGYVPVNVLNDMAEASKVKTDLIKNWALQDDIIAAMKYGDTFIEGGLVKTDFLDVDTIVARGIYAATIEALDVNFVRGTIGGNEITSHGIVGAKFSIIDGVIEAIDAKISGTLKTAVTGQRVVLDGTSNSLKFYDADGFLKVQISSGIVDPFGGSYSGIIVGQNYSLTESGFNGLGGGSTNYVTASRDGFSVGNLDTAVAMTMNQYGFVINSGAFTSRTASFVVGGNTYSFVNGVLVN